MDDELTMIIALCFGPSWAPHINIELFALLTNNPGSHTIHLVSEDLARPHIEHFHHIAAQFNSQVVYHDFSLFQHKFHPRNIKPRFTKYTLYRLALPSLLQEEKVLYLDSDTLVLGSLEDLWETPINQNYPGNPAPIIGDCWIAGVPDTGIKPHHHRQLRIQPKSTYVNGGVLLMALEPLRQLNWLELAATKAFPLNDQDIINKTCEGHILPIHFAYNVSLSTTLSIPREEVRVMHYAGKKKQWIDSLPNASWWYEWEQKYNNVFNPTTTSNPL